MSLTPLPAERFFAKSKDDKFTLKLDSVQLDNFDFLSYHKYRIITASRLILNGGSFGVFGNPTKTKQPTDRVVTYPNAGLYKINSDLKLDTVNLHGIDVSYTEFNKKSNKTGTITFNNTGGTFLNITTRPEALQKKQPLQCEFEHPFYEPGSLQTETLFLI